MQAKQTQKRFVLLALFSVVLAVSFYGFLYLPQRAELSAKQEETARLRKEIAAASSFRRAHPSPEKEARSLEKRTRLVDAMIPAQLDGGAFLAAVEKMAASSGVILLGVLPENARMTDGLAAEKMRLSVSGDYFALLDFLYALEQQGRFVKIDTMRGKVEDGVFKGDLELWIYARSI